MSTPASGPSWTLTYEAEDGIWIAVAAHKQGLIAQAASLSTIGIAMQNAEDDYDEIFDAKPANARSDAS